MVVHVQTQVSVPKIILFVRIQHAFAQMLMIFIGMALTVVKSFLNYQFRYIKNNSSLVLFFSKSLAIIDLDFILIK